MEVFFSQESAQITSKKSYRVVLSLKYDASERSARNWWQSSCSFPFDSDGLKLGTISYPRSLISYLCNIQAIQRKRRTLGPAFPPSLCALSWLVPLDAKEVITAICTVEITEKCATRFQLHAEACPDGNNLTGFAGCVETVAAVLIDLFNPSYPSDLCCVAEAHQNSDYILKWARLAHHICLNYLHPSLPSAVAVVWVVVHW